MTQAQLDLQKQLEQTSSDLTTQSLFIDSPVLFLESIDQVPAHPSGQIEQTEHTTSSKVHAPPEIHRKYVYLEKIEYDLRNSLPSEERPN